MAQSIVSNTLIATTGRGLNVLLGLYVFKLLANYLDAVGYGLYGLLFSIGTIALLIADFGLYLQLARSIAEEPHRQDDIISTIFSLRLALLVSVFLVGIAVMLCIPRFQPLVWSFSIMAIGLSFQSLSQLAMGIFQHQQVVWRATLGDLVGRLCQIGVVVAFGVWGQNLLYMTVAFTVSAALTWCIHYLTLPVKLPRLRSNWPAWQQLLASSWVLGASLVVSAIYFRVDIIMLFFLRSAAEVGWYAAAYKIIESILFLPAMFGGLLLPRLSEARVRRDWRTFSRYLSQGLTFQLVIVGFLVVTLLLKAQAILLLVSSEKFIPAAPILQLLSVALFFLFFGTLFGFTMVALQKQWTLLKLYLSLAGFNILSNLVVIPLWGMTAAATTTILTEAAATLVCAWIVWRAVRYRIPLRSFVGTALAAALAVVVYLIVPDEWPILFTVTLASFGYAAGISITRTVTAEQLSLLVTAKIP